jgi:hypothetical protein
MRFSVVVLALFFGGVVLTPAQGGVAGDWNLSFNTPGGTREAAMTVKVDGETLSGSMTSTEGGETPFKGTVNGNRFTLKMDVQTANGTFAIVINGEVDGDAMTGTMDFGQGTGEFTGKRKN